VSQIIKCPECKAEQPKQPICAHCGFDIRAYALSRQNAKSGGIICPDCGSLVPKQPICPKCGFDIRAHALAMKNGSAPARDVPCPNCFKKTPEHSACKHCGFDLRLIDQRELYKEAKTYTEKFIPTEPVVKASPPLPPKELFYRSWQRIRRRWGTLLGLYLFITLLTLIGLSAPLAASVLLVPRFYEYSNIIIMSGSLLATALSLLSVLWGIASITAAIVIQEPRFKESLKTGWNSLVSYAWQAVLASLLIFGGFFLFVVPGILFFVWIFAAQFIVFKEHERGLDALLKSRHYVRGHWASTFRKLLVIFGIAGVSCLIPFGPFISFPFVLSYLFEMYQDLRLLKVDEHPEKSPSWVKLGWACAGLVGLVLPMAIVIMLAGSPIMNIYHQVSSGDIALEQFIPTSLR
jgi:ribosomal protein L32